MANQIFIIRIMGESDIVDVYMTKATTTSSKLVNLDFADQINLLGHWVDQDRSAALIGDEDYLGAMTQIASGILSNSRFSKEMSEGENFALLTVLREKWPVGSKARFKAVADRVNAEHTYLAHVCAVSKIENLDVHEALKQEETRHLSIAFSFYKTNRRRFANSSAVQALIKG
ncbi:hypothetical protein N8500_03990 [Candidatus Puniceispirillum sp.]|nr:hypothetical protein [Candidatus Puniceispirillum sp.]